jgi:imidazolonepropionase-like amidohydrolase
VTAWRVDAVRLPDGDAIEAGIDASGRWAWSPPDGAETLPGRFVLPGLVDAHCHLSLGIGSEGWPVPLDAAAARANLDRARAVGVTAIRDTGSPASVTLQLLDTGIVACGRFLAPQGRYFAALHEPVPAERLVEAALAEIAAGARWVKVVADFPTFRPGEPPLEPSPTYPLADVERLVTAVHAAGARVAAHTTTRHVADLIATGIDSVEHGTALDEADLVALAARGGAWTPTLCATFATGPHRNESRLLGVHERLSHLLPRAAELGVTIMTGSDVAGTVAREVGLLASLGLPPAAALAAASTDARRFLGFPDLDEGEYADLVTFDSDPRDDPAVLARPAAVVANGVRLR